MKLNDIHPNPYKKWISGGELNQEQVDRLKANLKELGHMGAVPVVKIKNKHHMVSHHHRVEALKQMYGVDYEVEVTVHDYSDDQLFRGMVIENITQRKGEFREETENLVATRKYLKEINRPDSGQLKSKRKDGRGGRIGELGSVRHIQEWLNGIMSRGRISQLLQIFDALDPELYKQVEKTQKGPSERRGKVISETQATLLSTFKDKEEQNDLAKVLKNSKEQRVREQGKLLSIYKKAPSAVKKKIRQGKSDLADIQLDIEIYESEKKLPKKIKTLFIPSFSKQLDAFDTTIMELEQQVALFTAFFSRDETISKHKKSTTEEQTNLNTIFNGFKTKIDECCEKMDALTKNLKEMS